MPFSTLSRADRFVGALLVVFATAGAAFLAGCSNDPYPPGETARSTIYTVLSGDLKSLDPTVAYNVDEAAVIDCIYPSYYRYHHLKQAPYTLELALGAEEAKREPITVTVTEKGKTVTKQGEQWTFHLKKGLRFQDDPCFPGGRGREINAADVIYSFRRMADPKLPCPVLSFFQDKILGMDEYVKGNSDRSKQKLPADYAMPVEGLVLDSNDPYTFRIRLNQPYPQLRYLMTMHFTTPVPHEAVEKYGDDYARHPVGCGAYLMTEYLPKQRITLEINPNRFEEYYPSAGDPGDQEAGLLQDAGKRLPLADKVVFNYIKEGVTSWNLFLQGYLDSTGVSQENYRQVLSRPGQLSPEMVRKGIRLQKSTTPYIRYFAFNMKDPVWGGDKGKKLRQAVSLCLDAQQFIDLFSQGRGTPAQSIIAPGLFGYDPDYRNPYRQTSVDKAKQLLAEAGYPNAVDKSTGRKLVLTYDSVESGAAGRQFAALIKRQIEQCGIELDVQSWRDIVWEDRVHNGKSQFFSYGWLADYPDPENFVFLLYGPNGNGGINYANYDNPEYNRLFEQMRSMNDGPARLAVIKKMRDIAAEDCPWIYLMYPEGLGISYDWLRNNKPHGVANDGLKYVAIDGAKRARLQREWNRPNYWPIVGLIALLVVGAMPAVATVSARRNRSLRRNSPTGAPGDSKGGPTA